MSDPSEKINQLKIDRSVPVSKSRSWVLPSAGLAAIILVVAGWMLLGPGNSTVLVETDVARKPPSQAAANSVLDASGYVVARQQATVSSKISGKVTAIYVEEGMRVKQGQVLARLDDTPEQARLAFAQALSEL